MTIHKVTLRNNDCGLKAEILPSDGKSTLIIFFRHNKPPSLSKYDFKTTLPRQDFVDGSYTLFMAPEELRGSGDYYFGVLPCAHNGDCEIAIITLNYTFDIHSPACYFWNETSLDWSSRGCTVNYINVVSIMKHVATCFGGLIRKVFERFTLH